jgi:hypothetical protein
LGKSAPEQSWFVEEFSRDPRQINTRIVEQLRVATIPLFALMVFGEFLPEWSREETFAVQQVDWQERPSGRVAAVEFTYQWPSGKTHTHAYWPRSGTLFLRPDLCWAIAEFQVEMVDEADSAKREFHWSQKNELKELDGFPAVAAAVQQADSLSEGRTETTWTFTRFDRTELPESAFTLTAFGLPDVADSSGPTQLRLWMILVAAGVASILIAIWARYRAQAA